MKDQKNEDEKDASELSDQEEKKEGDQKKSKAANKKKDTSDRLQLPLLVEFAFTFSLIVLLLSDLSIVVISFISGANLLDITIRTVVTTIVLGVLLWLLVGKLSKGAIEAAYLSIYAEDENSSPNGIASEEKLRVEA